MKDLKRKNNFKNNLIICVLIGIVLGWISCYFFEASRITGNIILADTLPVLNKLLIENPINFEFFNFEFFLKGFGVGFLISMIVLLSQNGLGDATGREYGTADWNRSLKQYNKVFKDENPEANMILGDNLFLSMNGHKTRKNNNILVNGGSGAGKSRFVVKPNILQNAGYSSFVITDPSGELLQSTGHFLEQKGYKIKVFNLNDMAHSNCYNPFNYIREEVGVKMMIDTFIKNTNQGKSGGDPFWEKSETALLMACAYYLIEVCPKNEQNFSNILTLLRLAEIDENNPDAKSTLDNMFDELELKNPNSMAVKNYKIFKMGAGKTAKSILISAGVRLADFNSMTFKNLTDSDNLHLEKMGDELTALYVIIPAASTTYNYLVAMMYSQLFETLYHVAESSEGIHLKIPVRFLLDEFANIGTIPDFEKMLSTMRKYYISCTIIIQNMAQIKTMFKNCWETVVGNCDTFIFLGGNELNTTKYVSELLGKTTIKVRNKSTSRKGGNYSYNAAARDLMSPDEVGQLPDSMCIVKIKGINPFLIKKYPYQKHPNYQYTGDANPDLIYYVTQHFDTAKSAQSGKTTKVNQEELIDDELPQDVLDTIVHNNQAIDGEILEFDENFLKKMNFSDAKDFEENVSFDKAFSPNFEFEVPQDFLSMLEENNNDDNYDGLNDDIVDIEDFEKM